MSKKLHVQLCSILLAVAFGLVAAPQARSQEAPDGADSASTGSDAPADREPQSEAEIDRAQFVELVRDREEALAEATALDADAASFSGEDEAALRQRAIDLRLEGLHALGEMAEVIGRLEERNDDVTAESGTLARLLPGAGQGIQSDLERVDGALAELKTARDAAGAEGGGPLEPQIQRLERRALRILEEAVSLVEVAAELEIPTGVARSWIEDHVRLRARLATAHLGFARDRLDDLAAQLAAGGDPAALQGPEGAARLRLESTSQNLEALVGMMERLDVDASAYRRLLVESTGELTIDAIDRDVAGDLISRWVGGLREGLAENGPSFAFQALLFGLILTIFWGASRFVRKVVARAVEAPHLRFSQLLKRMIVSLATGAVIVLGLLVALSQLGIEVAPMLTGLGIAGFVLGFALQDTLGNFAAGIMILVYRPYDVGDMIDCAGGVFGQVNHMSLVSTTILTIDNKTLIVPNSKIWGDVITNVTAQSIRRVDMEFGIGYSDDIPKAEEVLESILADHPMILSDPEPVVKVHELGDSSVNFWVRPWCARDDYWDVFWDVTREVKMRFDREGVSIPFPQRDVHFYPTEPSDPPAKSSGQSEEMEISSTSISAQDEPDAEEG